jgi:hypothetical protein
MRELGDQLGHGRLQEVEDAGELGGASAVRVGDVRPVQARDVAEKADPGRAAVLARSR